METVQILLSTYNGEKYLAEQINSLIGQSHKPIEIKIRDDGSSDKTSSIVSRLCEENRNTVSISCEANIGVIESFFELLKHADVSASYYAFCDQDDVWKPGKLARAISRLKGVPDHIPAMYCSRTELVDEHLNHLNHWPPIPRREPSFANALVENIAVGCTIVMNRAAKELICKKFPDSKRVIMHDWWSYLCISAFGQVVYDSEPTVRYRQHASNVMGGTAGIVQKWSGKLISFRKNGKAFLLRKQAEEFLALFGDNLAEEKRKMLGRFVDSNSSFFKRAGYIYSTELFRHSIVENYLFRLLYLINRI